MKQRADRVNSLIQEELSKIILREVDLPGTLATITGVEVDSKMAIAIVRISFYPSEKAAESLKKINSRHSYLQHLLNQKLHIKPMPRIILEIDHGPENLAEVEKILGQ